MSTDTPNAWGKRPPWEDNPIDDKLEQIKEDAFEDTLSCLEEIVHEAIIEHLTAHALPMCISRVATTEEDSDILTELMEDSYGGIFEDLINHIHINEEAIHFK